MHNVYQNHLMERKTHHLGYPYNLNFSYSKYAYLLDYLVNNLGDPYVPSNYGLDSRNFEKKVVEYLSSLWNFNDCWGYVTSSGTEGNLAALLYGKLILNNPVVYYSMDTHYSISKGCMAYSLDSHVIKSQSHGEIDYFDLENEILKNQNRDALIICNISTTFRGAYDSPSQILSIFERCGISRNRIFLHGDAALGGMILPFLNNVEEEYEINGTKFFDSISVSGHKMPGVPIPCGVVLTKKAYIEEIGKEIEYLNSKDTTLNGSRNGLAAVLLYHALMDITKDEWRKKIQDCLVLAQYLFQSLKNHGFEAKINCYSNTVCFNKPSEDIVEKWQLACVGNEAHAIIMPNHNIEQIDLFVEELVNSSLLLSR